MSVLCAVVVYRNESTVCKSERGKRSESESKSFDILALVTRNDRHPFFSPLSYAQLSATTASRAPSEATRGGPKYSRSSSRFFFVFFFFLPVEFVWRP